MLTAEYQSGTRFAGRGEYYLTYKLDKNIIPHIINLKESLLCCQQKVFLKIRQCLLSVPPTPTTPPPPAPNLRTENPSIELLELNSDYIASRRIPESNLVKLGKSKLFRLLVQQSTPPTLFTYWFRSLPSDLQDHIRSVQHKKAQVQQAEGNLDQLEVVFYSRIIETEEAMD